MYFKASFHFVFTPAQTKLCFSNLSFKEEQKSFLSPRNAAQCSNSWRQSHQPLRTSRSNKSEICMSCGAFHRRSRKVKRINQYRPNFISAKPYFLQNSYLCSNKPKNYFSIKTVLYSKLLLSGEVLKENFTDIFHTNLEVIAFSLFAAQVVLPKQNLLCSDTVGLNFSEQIKDLYAESHLQCAEASTEIQKPRQKRYIAVQRSIDKQRIALKRRSIDKRCIATSRSIAFTRRCIALKRRFIDKRCITVIQSIAFTRPSVKKVIKDSKLKIRGIPFMQKGIYQNEITNKKVHKTLSHFSFNPSKNSNFKNLVSLNIKVGDYLSSGDKIGAINQYDMHHSSFISAPCISAFSFTSTSTNQKIVKRFVSRFVQADSLKFRGVDERLKHSFLHNLNISTSSARTSLLLQLYKSFRFVLLRYKSFQFVTSKYKSSHVRTEFKRKLRLRHERALDFRLYKSESALLKRFVSEKKLKRRFEGAFFGFTSTSTNQRFVKRFVSRFVQAEIKKVKAFLRLLGTLNAQIRNLYSENPKYARAEAESALKFPFINKANKTPIILPSSGRVLTISKTQLILQKTQPVLFYDSASLHVKKGEWVKQGAPILTLSHQTLITGDIVQGIPRIEQLFEAFTSPPPGLKERKGIDVLQPKLKNVHDTLHSRVRDIFRKNWLKNVLPIAVRKSLEEIQYIIVEMIQKVYLSQGVLIADKHIEIIIRQMTSKGQVLDSGSTGLLLEEVLPIRQIENANITTPGKKCLYVPAVVGLTAAALTCDSFISAASFQETTRVLSRDAVAGKSDFLRGLKEKVVIGDLISAGTGLDIYFIYTLFIKSI